MVKALPIAYKGITFRSRLEADWALTLDSLNVTWQYEPEGYELSDGTYYSPDFWLPSARSWLEVKGDHMLGVSKVGQFAADLWTESGATSTYDLDSPMVLLGMSPHPPDRLLTNAEMPRMQGVMGHGKGYSVGIATCPACDQGTVVALWQPFCRSCHTTFADGGIWFDSFMDNWMARPFRRVVRPAGRR